MRMTTIAIGAVVLALLAAPAFAQSDDDWVQVPSSRGATSEGGGAAKTTVEEEHSAIACAMVGALVQQAATMRDRGVTEQSQFLSIDGPDGRLYQIMLATDPAGTLLAGIHREIDYVYVHRDMTPAQLGTQVRQNCGNPKDRPQDAQDDISHQPVPGTIRDFAADETAYESDHQP